MKRIAVIGCPGAGKSTFSRRLQSILNIPIIHLDQIFWQPGWVTVDKEVFLNKTQQVYQQPEWIIDGNYLSSAGERFKHCDTIIHLDYPTWVCMSRVIKRTLSSYGQTRLDMTAGCPDRFDWEFFKYVLSYRRKMRPRALAAIQENKTESCQVVNLHTARQVEEYLESLVQSDT